MDGGLPEVAGAQAMRVIEAAQANRGVFVIENLFREVIRRGDGGWGWMWAGATAKRPSS